MLIERSVRAMEVIRWGVICTLRHLMVIVLQYQPPVIISRTKTGLLISLSTVGREQLKQCVSID